jgi:hypothetical protein
MKSLVVAPFIPISAFMGSHRAAQGVIYADQLVQNGEDVTVNFGGNVTHDFNQFDRVYVYHGNDWSGALNLYGGPDKFPYAWNFRNFTKFKGQVVSLVIPFPNYHALLNKKLNSNREKNKPILPEWDDCDFDNLLRIQNTAPVLRYPRVTKSIVIGDSHAICMYRPGWTVNSVPYKTLFGALKTGFEQFINDPYRDPSIIENIELYFGNIDIRHHLCRRENPAQATEEICRRYVDSAEDLYNKYPNLKTVSIYEPLLIESEKRKLPASGYYDKQPFFGSWAERNDIRIKFRDNLEKFAAGTRVNICRWVDYLMNEKGELDMEFMEFKQSVHLSRMNYPHWNGIEFNHKDIKKVTKRGIPKVSASKKSSLEGFL